MFEEVDRYALGHVSGVDWLGDDMLLVASRAGLYVMDANTMAWSLLFQGVDSLSLTADRTRAAVAVAFPRRPAVIDTTAGEILWEGAPIKQALTAVEISPDGAQIAWGEGRDTVHIADPWGAQEPAAFSAGPPERRMRTPA